MVSIAAIQTLEKVDQLKEQICTSKDINSPETLAFQQQLRIIYQQFLTLDLEYALDQKVEQDLWNHGFKNNFNKLQQLAKDKKASRGDSLSIVFYYMRSINVRHSFLAAINNLNFTLNKYISSSQDMLYKTKITIWY